MVTASNEILPVAPVGLRSELLYALNACTLSMVQHISESEMERITEFAETPVYERTPEQLMPDSNSDD
jgi:hypothetical protein